MKAKTNLGKTAFCIHVKYIHYIYIIGPISDITFVFYEKIKPTVLY